MRPIRDILAGLPDEFRGEGVMARVVELPTTYCDPPPTIVKIADDTYKIHVCMRVPAGRVLVGKVIL